MRPAGIELDKIHELERFITPIRAGGQGERVEG